MRHSDTRGCKRNELVTENSYTVSFNQCDFLFFYRPFVLKHKEDSGHPGFGWRIYTDHIPSQIEGELYIQCGKQVCLKVLTKTNNIC